MATTKSKAKPKKTPATKRTQGNQAKYGPWLTADGLLCIEAWARDGLDMDRLALKCGVTRETFRRWIKMFPEIAKAVSKGKDPYDIEVENALHNRALGYTIELKKTFKVRRIDYDAEGRKVREYEELVVGIDEMHVPADTTAEIFWLKNRKPDEWREKRESILNMNLDVEDLTPLAELLKL